MTAQAKTALGLVGVAIIMVSLSFAAVPFYRWFCQVTGFAGTTSISTAAPDTILDRTMIVRFDASTAAGMPWEFKPQQRKMTLRIGETALAFYEAYNPTDHTVAGTASFNVTPDQAGGYFSKIECFCFSEQILKAHERAILPVLFFIDPAMVNDPEAGLLQEITISYTFYETPLSELASVSPAAETATN